MPPERFTVTGEGTALKRLLRDEVRLVGLDAARRNPWWGVLALLPLIGLGAGVMRSACTYKSAAPTMRYPFEPPADRPPAAVTYVVAGCEQPRPRLSRDRNGFGAARLWKLWQLREEVQHAADG